ncbi:hypothetical protein [Moraxella bovis]|uniref:hypothetical protein n=1 Tax=Moraxella bovis TaxID=476 RepID=UPI0011C02115|nr:hypothetical protein [Moraxella bovis]
MKIKEHIQYQSKYLKPKYDYENFEREREMIGCILYSTIGQESMDWVKEWSDIPYEIFTGTEPNSYGYDQVKLFVENYYELMKETGRLKMFINEDYYFNKWREKHKDKKRNTTKVKILSSVGRRLSRSIKEIGIGFL